MVPADYGVGLNAEMFSRQALCTLGIRHSIHIEFLQGTSTHGSDDKNSIPRFQVSVESGGSLRWSVVRHFTDFCVLHDVIGDAHASLGTLPALPRFPERRAIFMRDNQERSRDLQHYMRFLLTLEPLLQSEPVLRFLCSGAMKVKETVGETAYFTDLDSESEADDGADVMLPEVTSVNVGKGMVAHCGDKVIYQVKVENSNKPPGFDSWAVMKQFSDFRNLHKFIRSSLQRRYDTEVVLAAMPRFPPREPKFLVDHHNPQFIEIRRHQLDEYLRRVFSLTQGLPEQWIVLEFLGVV